MAQVVSYVIHVQNSFNYRKNSFTHLCFRAPFYIAKDKIPNIFIHVFSSALFYSVIIDATGNCILTSVRVFLETPQPIGQTTGYRIYYTSPTSSGSVSVDDPLTSNEFVYGLTNGETYTFSVAGRSFHIESEPSTLRNPCITGVL